MTTGLLPNRGAIKSRLVLQASVKTKRKVFYADVVEGDMGPHTMSEQEEKQHRRSIERSREKSRQQRKAAAKSKKRNRNH